MENKTAVLLAAFSSLFCISYCGAMNLLEHYTSRKLLTPELASIIFAFLFTVIIFKLIKMYYSDKFCKCGKNKKCSRCERYNEILKGTLEDLD